MTSEVGSGSPPDEPVLSLPATSKTDTASPDDPGRRLRELRAIPERNRTDAQWDELNELEIQFAPGNRADGAAPAGKSPSSGERRPRSEWKKPMGKRNHPGKQSPKAKPDPVPR
jgi:hypothetical protein